MVAFTRFFSRSQLWFLVIFLCNSFFYNNSLFFFLCCYLWSCREVYFVKPSVLPVSPSSFSFSTLASSASCNNLLASSFLDSSSYFFSHAFARVSIIACFLSSVLSFFAYTNPIVPSTIIVKIIKNTCHLFIFIVFYKG